MHMPALQLPIHAPTRTYTQAPAHITHTYTRTCFSNSKFLFLLRVPKATPRVCLCPLCSRQHFSPTRTCTRKPLHTHKCTCFSNSKFLFLPRVLKATPSVCLCPLCSCQYMPPTRSSLCLLSFRRVSKSSSF